MYFLVYLQSYTLTNKKSCRVENDTLIKKHVWSMYLCLGTCTTVHIFSPIVKQEQWIWFQFPHKGYQLDFLFFYCWEWWKEAKSIIRRNTLDIGIMTSKEGICAVYVFLRCNLHESKVNQTSVIGTEKYSYMYT